MTKIWIESNNNNNNNSASNSSSMPSFVVAVDILFLPVVTQFKPCSLRHPRKWKVLIPIHERVFILIFILISFSIKFCDYFLDIALELCWTLTTVRSVLNITCDRSTYIDFSAACVLKSAVIIGL